MSELVETIQLSHVIVRPGLCNVENREQYLVTISFPMSQYVTAEVSDSVAYITMNDSVRQSYRVDGALQNLLSSNEMTLS